MPEMAIGSTCPGCGALEHDPVGCLVCEEVGNWAETDDSSMWIMLHDGKLSKTVVHLWGSNMFNGSLADCLSNRKKLLDA